MVSRAFDDELHAKLETSVTNGVVGVLEASSLALSLIGAGLASSQGLDTKHAVKQVDRLLSNRNLQLEQLDLPWVRFVLGERKDVVIALDWTEYARDGHSVIAANVVTSHGRATPLLWKTVAVSDIKDGARNDFEDELLLRLHAAIPDDVRVTIIADRGFGDTKLYEFLARERWNFVIRFRESILVTTANGKRLPAADLVPAGGRARLFKSVALTANEHPVAGFVAVKAAGMKDAWCLATNRTDLTATQIVALYGKRFTIEETFRDAKNPRFGLGLSEVRLKRTIELRSADAQPLDLAPALSALAVGLTYDEGALSAAEALVAPFSHDEVAALRREVWRTGLKTPFRGKPLAALAPVVLDIAKGGLARRAIKDGEGRDETRFLSSLIALAASATTPAEMLLARIDPSKDLRAEVVRHSELETPL